MNEIIKNDPVLSSYSPLIKKMEAHTANGVNGAEEAAAHYRELFNKRLKELNVNDASQFDITDLGLHQFNAAKVAIKKPFSYNKYGGIIK